MVLAARRRVGLGELDALALQVVDRADMLASEPSTSMCYLIFATSAIARLREE